MYAPVCYLCMSVASILLSVTVVVACLMHALSPCLIGVSMVFASMCVCGHGLYLCVSGVLSSAGLYSPQYLLLRVI